MKLPCDRTIPKFYSKESKAGSPRNNCILTSIAVLLTTARKWKHPKGAFMSAWINKMW
jgi:hypothetical protein